MSSIIELSVVILVYSLIAIILVAGLLLLIRHVV